MSWGCSTLVSEVYDLDKPIGHSYGDVEYYTRLLSGVDGRILELASGTGRILIRLLESGLDVEGLDHSSEMLAVCRRHCRSRSLDPVLHEANMTSFKLPGTYEAVIIPAGSINDVDGRDAVLRTLTCCREALVPGGRLLVDVEPPQLDTTPNPMRYWRRDRCLWTLQTVHIDYDPAANRSIELLRYEKWREGVLLTTELHPFCFQNWSPDEFGKLLVEAGFSDITATADYQDDHRPGPDDHDWTFHAVRPVIVEGR